MSDLAQILEGLARQLNGAECVININITVNIDGNTAAAVELIDQDTIKAAHAAYQRGQRDPATIAGHRAYDRERKRNLRRNRAETERQAAASRVAAWSQRGDQT